jgi:PPOX class probable F420-dependent enzyme
MRDPILTEEQRDFVERARRAILATIAPDGRPRLVPICFVLDVVRPVLYSPLDEKPKDVDDPRLLARVLDIGRDPRVSVLVDRWDEDWSRLGWVRLTGSATLVEPTAEEADEHRIVVAMLRRRYEPYREHDLERRPLIRVTVDRATSWGAIREPGR